MFVLILFSYRATGRVKTGSDQNAGDISRAERLEEAHDTLFGTPVLNTWWVIHKGTGRTVVSIHAPWQKAEQITRELAAVHDWSAIDYWDEDEVARFAGRYLAEVEVPRYINEFSEWDDDVPYGEHAATSSTHV